MQPTPKRFKASERGFSIRHFATSAGNSRGSKDRGETRGLKIRAPKLWTTPLLCVLLLAAITDVARSWAQQPTPNVQPPPQPASAQAQQRDPKLPQPTSISLRPFTPEAARDKTLYSFHAENLELKSALALFARANKLNIVPDSDVTGQVTMDVQDLPLELMMQALLEAHDVTWSEQGRLIRVRTAETRMFNVDYLRLSRKGMGKNIATLGSGASGGGGGGQGGQGGGGGGGGGQGGGGGGGVSTVGSVFGVGSSSVDLTADNPIDFWKEMTEEIGFMLTPAGKSSMSINRTAGIIQITDRPSALKRVESYLAGVDKNVHRQVEIEAKLYDVTLGDQFQFGIDWVHVAAAYGGAMGFGGATLPVAIGGGQLQGSAIGGLDRLAIIGTSRSTVPGGNLSALVFSNFNTSAAVTALKQQGTVEVISTPKIRTLNNQTAMIKVGEEVPFFNTSTTFVPTTLAQSSPLQQTLVSSITIGTILSLTPQVSGDDWISLEISPVLTSLKAVVSFSGTGGGIGGGGGAGNNGSSGATAPDLDTKQASTLVRVRGGTTVVIGGLIQTQRATNETKVPILGDIPVLGKLFTGRFRFNQKKELVIFVTPTIIP